VITNPAYCSNVHASSASTMTLETAVLLAPTEVDDAFMQIKSPFYVYVAKDDSPEK
jgi:hypothetical protein